MRINEIKTHFRLTVKTQGCLAIGANKNLPDKGECILSVQGNSALSGAL